ncbi:hypothetical protein LFU01_17330 [Lysinibacillus fusiformis]|nr:hypothetical protein LFU01_17330 [Lysinibacillus fusiformis]
MAFVDIIFDKEIEPDNPFDRSEVQLRKYIEDKLSEGALPYIIKAEYGLVDIQ